MSPDVRLEPMDKIPIKWRWISYLNEETGETYQELCCAIVRYNKDTNERWTVPIGIHEAEVNRMTSEELDKLKGQMIDEAIEQLEAEGYTERYYRRPWHPGMERKR